MMTREDILRELELLPVWQLRSSAAMKTTSEPTTPTATPESVMPIKQEVEPAIVIEEVAIEQEITRQVFRYLASEDENWLFVLAEPELTIEEQHLLQNIFKAMRLKIKPSALTENIAEVISAIQPKLLIPMGQAVAQAILQTNEALDNLRGTPQKFEDVVLMATYDLAHLLVNSSDKAKVWNDLCVAMQYMQDLSS
jgi:uracil-DNA glycosylase